MSSLSPKDRVSLCSFTFSDGRRCRTPRISNHPHFCFYHAQKEARACAADKLGKDLAYFFSGDYLSACDLSTALARLIPAVVRGEVKPKTAHTVAYLVQTLMQAIHVSQHEYCEAFSPNAWRQAIRNSVKGNYDYLFPPDPQPAPQPAATPINCHSERSEESASSFAPLSSPAQPVAVAHPARGEESASSSNSSLATRHSPPPQQPAPSPHTPLPPTSAEFVQQVLAGLHTGGGQAPQPAQQPAETPINCHSERSRPTFSSAFASANASACAVEESAFSSSPAPPQIQAQQSVSAPSANPPQAAPVAQSFRSGALPPHVRRRLHRAPA